MMMMAVENGVVGICKFPCHNDVNEGLRCGGCSVDDKDGQKSSSMARSKNRRRRRNNACCCRPWLSLSSAVVTTRSISTLLFLLITTTTTTATAASRRWNMIGSHRHHHHHDNWEPKATTTTTRTVWKGPNTHSPMENAVAIPWTFTKCAKIDGWNCTESSSSSSSRQLGWIRIRGGVSANNDQKDENDSEELAMLITENKTSHRATFWSTLSSPFEMNDHTKEEASSLCENDHPDDYKIHSHGPNQRISVWMMEELKRKLVSFVSSSSSSGGGNPMVSSTQTGRGGALLVKEKPPRTNMRSNKRPMSILHEYVRKISWTQTWVDHLPDDDDEKEYMHVSQATEPWYTNNNNDDGGGGGDGSVEAEPAVSIDATAVWSHHSSSVDTNTANASTITSNSGTIESSEKKRKRKKNAINKDENNHVPIYPVKSQKLKKKHNVTDTEIPIDSVNVTSSLNNVNASTIQENSDMNQSSYVSSGYWNSIDNILTLGYVHQHPEWRVSSRLRTVRKMVAHVTGLHGLLSGKPYTPPPESIDDLERLGLIRRRLAAIDRARRNVERAATQTAARERSRTRFFFWNSRSSDNENFPYTFAGRRSNEEMRDIQRRKERVRDIDREMNAAQKRLQDLACEKDVLQRRYNPLWSYSAETTFVPKTKNNNDTIENETTVTAARQFNFPSNEMVDEYLDMLFASGRIEKLNHTDLWRIDNVDDEDDDDDFLSPLQREEDRRRRAEANENSGSWILRNGIGEKIGETAETAAYRAVCHAIMGILARVISNLHGLNVMTYSDVRLYTEQAPELPPLSAGMIPGSSRNRNYAQATLQDAMRKGSRNNKYRRRNDAFIQRDAVVETLTSQCQIAAPLMKLFPLAWQRAILGNIVTLVTSVVADFCEGIEFQILGHRLSLSFVPITEEDMLRSMGRGNSMFNPRRINPEQFEAAVRATAEELSENLKFLDRWHERALGGGMLRTQIAMLIARLVLTLTDDVLGGSKIDLWTAHAGGPRIISALEYRTTPNYMDEATGI